MVEVDTLEVRPVPGVVFKQFTARDVVSRWDVIQAHGRATAQSATAFLDTLQLRMPFPIRAVKSNIKFALIAAMTFLAVLANLSR